MNTPHKDDAAGSPTQAPRRRRSEMTDLLPESMDRRLGMEGVPRRTHKEPAQAPQTTR